jgi:hypothetical protein
MECPGAADHSICSVLRFAYTLVESSTTSMFATTRDWKSRATT